MLEGEGLTVHVSGDNASLDVVREIASRADPVDVAVLFAGHGDLLQRSRRGSARACPEPDQASGWLTQTFGST
ncbi:hypothetical protein [Nonomuraea longispora]|uniref:hypothetical protein n=1 Tax=Nonomuraea longispora TaxID=1848320 RepID=UPI001FE7459F|nr:hypothetical protein [Nonomuraea longispora]